MTGESGDESYYVFSYSKTEAKKAREWMDEHDKKKHLKKGQKFRYSGAIGGAYTWCFTPTSIGTSLTIKCSCGDKKDVTDYDIW